MSNFKNLLIFEIAKLWKLVYFPNLLLFVDSLCCCCCVLFCLFFSSFCWLSLLFFSFFLLILFVFFFVDFFFFFCFFLNFFFCFFLFLLLILLVWKINQFSKFIPLENCQNPKIDKFWMFVHSISHTNHNFTYSHICPSI